MEERRGWRNGTRPIYNNLIGRYFLIKINVNIIRLFIDFIPNHVWYYI